MAKTKAVNYSLIEDAGPHSMLQELVGKYHDHLAEARIALVWRYGLAPDKDGHIELGKARKASDLDRELKDWDFVITLNYDFWSASETADSQRLALLDHELSHCAMDMDDNGKPREDDRGRIVYRMQKHDVEDFIAVVQRHGQYKRDLEEFARALVKDNDQDE